MREFKKFLCLILTIIMLCGIFMPVMAASETKVTMYAPDGRTKEVLQSEVEANKKVGWYTEAVAYMYHPDGRVQIVKYTNINTYKNAGWYRDPVTYVYSPTETKVVKKTEYDKYIKNGWYAEAVANIYSMDGRKKVVKKTEVDAYLKVGWYDSPIITVYSMDGRAKKIPSSKKAAYLKVGWYDSPIITMYTEDGRTKKIPTSQKEAYKKVGWYYGKVITIYAGDGRSKKIGANEKADYLKVGWYEVPMVTVGTLDGRSKVIKKKDLEAYKKVGWYHIPYVKIETKKIEKGFGSLTNQYRLGRYGYASDIQQFKYKNEGFAYAEMAYHAVKITLPSKILNVEVDCAFRDVGVPVLGDAIADDDGNIYIIWGQENKNPDNKEVNTVFITKYSPTGVRLKTVGFKGKEVWGITGRTRDPFHAGNCDSEIANGILVVNYARQMYNGHQSNDVIGVNLSDMSPVKFEGFNSAPYVSHSFNQRVIYSKLAKCFVYANQGDVDYTRGFIISYKGRDHNIFHFYMQSNARGSDYLTNRTFAQMGSLVETSKGIVLVGASAKSIGLKTPSEVQNLFVQVMKPNVFQVSADFFVGGSKRSGETSFNYKDRNNTPLTPVTDYGVRWLTNYTSKDVILPHAVVVNDKIVILWNTPGEKEYTTVANYAVLANDGKVIVPPTVLSKDIPLNSMEDPIYHNGKIWWVGNNKVINIQIAGL